MVFEVEEKVKIEGDLEATRRKLISMFTAAGTEVKYDSYFKNETTGRLVRMRESANGLLVTTKQKQKPNGIDQEIEFGITNKEIFYEFMQTLGFNEFFKKVKRVESFLNMNILIELVHVDDLGDFVEVEILEQDENRVDEALQKVHETLFRLGYEEKDFIKKSYHELLLG